MANNGVNIRLFLHRLSAGFMNIAYIHGKVYAIGGYLPMRWVEYDHEEVSFSMDKYSIHGSAISMGTMQQILQFVLALLKLRISSTNRSFLSVN